jgi:DNA-binding transcriptional ArsR family regulator
MNSDKVYTQWAEVLKTLGHPLRLRIVKLLSGNQMCVWDIWNSLNIQQSVVSQHLAILRKKGIVGCVRQGTYVKYFVKTGPIENIIKLVDKS